MHIAGRGRYSFLIVIALLCFAFSAILPASRVKAQTENAQTESAQPVRDPQNAQPSSQADDRIPFMIADTAPQSEQPSAMSLLGRTLGAMSLIIGIIVAAGYAMKRVMGAGSSSLRKEAPLTLVSTVSIGDKRTLSVVKFGEKLLLIGSTPQSIKVLASDEFDSIEYGEAPAAAAEEQMKVEKPSPRSVAEILNGSEAIEWTR